MFRTTHNLLPRRLRLRHDASDLSHYPSLISRVRWDAKLCEMWIEFNAFVAWKYDFGTNTNTGHHWTVSKKTIAAA